MTAAKVIQDKCIGNNISFLICIHYPLCFSVETGKVKCFVRNSDGWAWMPEFEVKFVRGTRLASGSFRDAYHIRIVHYGDLPSTEFVLKLWNTRAVEGRQTELGSSTQMETLEDLTKRVCIQKLPMIYS
jgi:hypothetical protein